MNKCVFGVSLMQGVYPPKREGLYEVSMSSVHVVMLTGSAGARTKAVHADRG